VFSSDQSLNECLTLFFHATTMIGQMKKFDPDENCRSDEKVKSLIRMKNCSDVTCSIRSLLKIIFSF